MAKGKSRMSAVKRAREAALKERREQKAEKKRVAREARAVDPEIPKADPPGNA